VDLARLAAGALGPTVLILATALVVGRWVLGRLVPDEGVSSLPIATTVGLVAVGTALLGLGLLHLLRLDVVVASMAAVHLLAARWWGRSARAAWTWLRLAGWPAGAVAGGLAVGLAPMVALALYPPVEFDATSYHLPYARAFAEVHALPFLPELVPPIFPQLQEVLFATGFLLGSDVAPQVLQLASVLLVALLLLAWRADGVPVVARLWAAALWLGAPFVVWLGTIAYVDAGMALQTTGALYAWRRAREPAAAEGWWVVAGVCAGGAAGIKYLGLFFVAAIGLAALHAAWSGRRAAPLLAFAAAAAVTAGPWYLRLCAETGDPVFPYFARWFGAPEWDPALQPHLGRYVPPALATGPWSMDPAEAAEAVRSLVTLPWTWILFRERYGWLPPPNPFDLLLLPLLLPVAAARRASRPLVLVALAYATAWLAGPRDPRYLLAVLPAVIIALMAAATAVIAPRRPALTRRPAVVLAITLLLAVPGWYFACNRLGRQGPPPTAAPTRDAYLATRVPGYEAIAWLNDEHGADYAVYALFGGRLAYHARGRFTGGWIGPARYERLLAVAADPVAFDAELGRLGAGYLLIVTDQWSLSLPATPDWQRRFTLVRRGPSYTLYRRTA